ncbi:hypothetical protein [Antrihabitans spumae]|uniref:FHA domain-containing protein n=1 Tax=Antrihabitans spumae TaxID=3373370 RepID=A0ABW7K528_9NOCA
METDGVGDFARADVEYCGERYALDVDAVFYVGRDADLSIDDNRYLHRRCLSIHYETGMWWLANVGSRIPAKVSEATTGFAALLVPGTRIPLVYGMTTVVVAAGPTTYEFAIETSSAVTNPTPPPHRSGETTIGAPALTAAQLALIVALAEPLLLRDGVDASAIPSSARAAERLGWPLTKFNRKLDNVCDKFDRIGVSGLRGGPGRLASNRRARLVEFAISSRLVTKSDLGSIDDQRRLCLGLQHSPRTSARAVA